MAAVFGRFLDTKMELLTPSKKDPQNRSKTVRLKVMPEANRQLFAVPKTAQFETDRHLNRPLSVQETEKFNFQNGQNELSIGKSLKNDPKQSYKQTKTSDFFRPLPDTIRPFGTTRLHLIR